MWGNLKGWLIAGLLLAVIVFSSWQVSKVNEISPPTAFGLAAKRLAPLKLAVAPSSIVPMSGGGDATALYQQAINDVASSTARYESFIKKGDLKDVAALGGVGAIINARAMSAGAILAPRLEKNIGYFPDGISPDLDSIIIASNALARSAALHFSKKQYKEAEEQYSALFSLGDKLFNERISFMEARQGIGMMGTGVSGLKQIAATKKDTARLQALDNFDVARLDLLRDPMDETWKVINGVSSATIARHAGDIFYMTTAAENERMWRIEATLILGRFKYNVGGAQGRLADQAGAEKRLIELANDPDPAVAAAARAATALKIEQYRMIK